MKFCPECGACLVIVRSEKGVRGGKAVRSVQYGCANRRCPRRGQRLLTEEREVREEEHGGD